MTQAKQLDIQNLHKMLFLKSLENLFLNFYNFLLSKLRFLVAIFVVSSIARKKREKPIAYLKTTDNFDIENMIWTFTYIWGLFVQKPLTPFVQIVQETHFRDYFYMRF